MCVHLYIKGFRGKGKYIKKKKRLFILRALSEFIGGGAGGGGARGRGLSRGWRGRAVTAAFCPALE